MHISNGQLFPLKWQPWHMPSAKPRGHHSSSRERITFLSIYIRSWTFELCLMVDCRRRHGQSGSTFPPLAVPFFFSASVAAYQPSQIVFFFFIFWLRQHIEKWAPFFKTTLLFKRHQAAAAAPNNICYWSLSQKLLPSIRAWNSKVHDLSNDIWNICSAQLLNLFFFS